MRNTERTILYVGLVLAIALSLGWRGVGAPAAAQPDASSAVPRIATADVLGVVEKLFFSDKYRPAREATVAEANKKLQPYLTTEQDLRGQIMQLAPEDAKRQELMRAYQANEQARQGVQQDEQQRIEQFNTQQLIEAYHLVSDAAAELASKRGYTHLFATKHELSPNLNAIPSAVQEMLGRPVILYDKGNDLTEELVKQFKVENVVVGQQPQGPAQPMPQPPAGEQPKPGEAPKPADKK